MRGRRLAVVACVPALALAACQQPTTRRPEVSPAELAAEEAHQQRLVDEAGLKGGAPRPWRNRPRMRKEFEDVAERIEEAGAALCQEMGLPKQKRRCYYYFDTSRSLEINAYADGKYIIVTRGMQRFVRDENELAVVMAHELAHNLMGHIDAKHDNAMAGTLLGAALDAAAAWQGVRTGGDFGDLGTEAGKLSYSISFEQEADYVGLYIAARAGYDIRRAPELWRRMSVEEPEGIYASETHPSNAARAAALRKGMGEIEEKRRHKMPLLPEVQRP